MRGSSVIDGGITMFAEQEYAPPAGGLGLSMSEVQQKGPSKCS